MRKYKTVAELAKLDPIKISEADLDALADDPSLTEAEKKTLLKIEWARAKALVAIENKKLAALGVSWRLVIRREKIAA
jgi:hypothetical protein